MLATNRFLKRHALQPNKEDESSASSMTGGPHDSPGGRGRKRCQGELASGRAVVELATPVRPDPGPPWPDPVVAVEREEARGGYYWGAEPDIGDDAGSGRRR